MKTSYLLFPSGWKKSREGIGNFIVMSDAIIKPLGSTKNFYVNFSTGFVMLSHAWNLCIIFKCDLYLLIILELYPEIRIKLVFSFEKGIISVWCFRLFGITHKPRNYIFHLCISSFSLDFFPGLFCLIWGKINLILAFSARDEK